MPYHPYKRTRAYRATFIFYNCQCRACPPIFTQHILNRSLLHMRVVAIGSDLTRVVHFCTSYARRLCGGSDSIYTYIYVLTQTETQTHSVCASSENALSERDLLVLWRLRRGRRHSHYSHRGKLNPCTNVICWPLARESIHSAAAETRETRMQQSFGSVGKTGKVQLMRELNANDLCAKSEKISTHVWRYAHFCHSGIIDQIASPPDWGLV